MGELARLGRYQLLRRLGGGGMAEVFLARQTGLRGFEKRVVVKRIRTELAKNPEFVARFMEEVRTTADLTHPNVVAMFDAGQVDGQYFLVMEYLEGVDLAALRRERDRAGTELPRRIALAILVEAARGLHHAHTQCDLRGELLGVVHRDISPENILVTVHGVAKIIDFGVAQLEAGFVTRREGEVIGKAPYLAPEQALGERVGPAADQFALGVVAWELVCGDRLFARQTRAETLEAVRACKVPDPRSLNPRCPDPVADAIVQSLALRPERRFPDVGAFADALDAWRRGAGEVATAAEVGSLVRDAVGDRASAEATADAGPAPADAGESGDEEVTATEATRADSVAVSVLASNLPVARGSFVGRERDLDRLEELVRSGQRLVTLTGVGGVGKSRLALRYGEQHVGDYLEPGGGVWLAAASVVDDPVGVCRVISSALDLDVGEVPDLDALVRTIGRGLAQRGRTLLIVDGVDRSADTLGEILSRWTERAPELQLLATGRTRLAAPGEVVHELGPLAVPGENEGGRASEAVRLFVDRANAARGARDTAEVDLESVAELVRRLDGIPLAIELAAARMPVMSAGQMLERLGQRFALLSRPDAGEARHATLAATIAWSWDLLEEHERLMLARCSVFRGGFSLSAAEAVCGVDEGGALAIDVLQGLRGKSLLRAVESGESEEPRFDLFESIRAFAAEHLPTDDPAVMRHAAHYVELGEAMTLAVQRPGARRALRRLEREVENLRAVGERLAESDPAMSVRATLALEPILMRRTPSTVARALTRTAVARARDAGLGALEIHARRLLAMAIHVGGDLDECLEILDEGVRVARALDDAELGGSLLSLQGLVMSEQGRTDEARTTLQAARALLAEGDNPDELALVLIRSGVVEARALRDDEARRQWQEAYETADAAGNATRAAAALQNLAILIQRTDPAAAVEYVEKSLATYESLGDATAIATSYINLGVSETDLGQVRQAIKTLKKSLTISARRRDANSAAVAGANLVVAEHLSGDIEGAARRAREVRRDSERLGYRWLGTFAAFHEAALLARLGRVEDADRAFEAAAAAQADLAIPNFDALYAILLAFLDLARAAKASGADREVHLEAARMRVAAAEAEGEHSAANDTDVRLAVRLVRGALAAAG